METDNLDELLLWNITYREACLLPVVHGDFELPGNQVCAADFPIHETIVAVSYVRMYFLLLDFGWYRHCHYEWFTKIRWEQPTLQ